MCASIPRPPYDRELGEALPTLTGIGIQTILPEMIPELRVPTPLEPLDEMLERVGGTRRDVVIPGYQDDEILLTIISPKEHRGDGPGFFYVHGGGMMLSDRFSHAVAYSEWALEAGGVCVTVEYRLAPEHPDPWPVEDCYAGLRWTAEHCAELGINPEALLVIGGSAGGGLAAGITLMARDRGGPALLGQLLMCPMLDDRDRTVSTRQFSGTGLWDRESNRTGWSALLGDRYGGDEVSVYAAPARAEDLSGLPATFLDVGSAEVFRDEIVEYASRLWAAGVAAELHVWQGGFHSSEAAVPGARLSAQTMTARKNWLDRLLR